MVLHQLKFHLQNLKIIKTHSIQCALVSDPDLYILIFHPTKTKSIIKNTNLKN